jgi:hypothetical protein
MSKSVLFRWLTAVLALGLMASACGSDRDDADADATTTTTAATATTAPDSGDDGGTPTTTEPAEPDPCEGVTLEATEIGVSEDTIKVIVMADNESPLAPGLFDGARVGAFAWADDLNARGGIACRDVEIEFVDSMLNRDATVGGFLTACSDALALVGTTVLLGQNTEDLNSCPDMAGNPTGVPDLAYITTEVAHQCSSTSFHMSRPGASCPYDGGPRDYAAAAGAVEYLIGESTDPLHGIILIPGDFQTTRDATVPQILAHENAGLVYDGYFGVSGAATLSAFTPFVQRMRDSESNWIYNGSNDATMINMLEEAANQGLDLSDSTILCTLSCYTPAFLDQGDLVEGVYVWMFFLPFEEADTNTELAAFMNAIDDPFPAAWAAGAWADGILFELAINKIVDRDGPNGITRQSLIDELRTVTDFDVNGWWGPADFSTSLTTTDCFVLTQIQNNEFVRIHPAERGELACDTGNVFNTTADPADFAPDT